MGRVQELLYKAILDVTGIDRPLAGVGSKLDDLNKKSTIPLTVDAGSAAAQLNGVGAAINTQVRSINEWKTKLKELKTELGNATDTATVNRLTAAIAAGEAEVKKLKTPIKDAFDPEPPKKFGDGVGSIEGQIKKTGSALGGLKDGLSKAFQLGGGLAVVDVLKSTLSGIGDQVITFDKNISNVGSLGVKNFREVGDELLQQSKTIPKDAGDLANATYQAISAGIDPTKVVSFIEQAGKTAVAGQATTEQSVNALTSILNAYKLKTSETATVSDQLFGAIKFGKTTFNELNSVLGSTVPTAASLGVGFDQVAAGIAAMTNQGVPTAQAGTQIRQVLVELQKPGKDLEAVMQRAGASLEDLKNPAIGLTGTLQKINVEAAKNGQSMAQVFSSVEAGSAALLLSGDNFQKASETLTNVRGAAGVANEAFDVMNQSLDSQMQLAKNYISAALIPIGQQLLGSVLKGVQFVAGAIDTMSQFVSRNSGLIKILGAGIGSMVLLMNVGRITSFFGGIASGAGAAGLSILQKLVPALVTQTASTVAGEAAQLSFNTAMLANPIFLGLAALIAGVAIAYAVFSDHTKKLTDATSDVNDELKKYDEQIKKADATKTAADSASKLADEYDRLSKSTKPEDHKRLAEVTKEIDQVTQGAAVSVDQYGNAISANTDKVRQFANEQKNLSDQMRADALQSLIDQSADLSDSYHKNKKDAVELREVANSHVEGNLATSIVSGLGIIDKKYHDSKEARKGLAEASKNAEAAETALVSSIAKFDSSKGGKATVDQVAQAFRLNNQEAGEFLNRMRQMQDASNDAAKPEEKKEVAAKKTKEHHESILAKIKEQVDAQVDQFETGLKLQRIAEHRTFTSQDELLVARLRDRLFDAAVLKQEKALRAQKEFTKAQAEGKHIDLGVATVQLKVQTDSDKVRADIEKLTVDIAHKNIEVGISARDANLKLLEREVEKTKTNLGKSVLKFDLSDPLSLKAILDAQLGVLNAQLGVKKEVDAIDKESLDLAKKVAGLKIDLITDEAEKERAIENEKNRETLADAKGNSQLIELEKQRHTKALEAIDAKYNTTRKQLEAGVQAFLVNLHKDRKSISDDEAADKKDSLAKELTDAKDARAKGTLTEVQYQRKLRQITQDRVTFEKQLEQEKKSAFVQSAEELYGNLSKKAAEYFENLALQYLLDLIFHTSAEEGKTAATVAGAAARALASIAEVAGSLLSAGASMVAAVAAEIYGAVASLGPILGPIVAGTGTAALIALFANRKKVLGFEHGGIGLVGERGPEIIGPTKEFAEYSAQLSAMIFKAAVQEFSQARRATGGGRSKVEVSVSGRITERGRDTSYRLEREKLAHQNEVMAS